MKITTLNDLEKMESRSRANMINALSGYKSPMLLGSGSKENENLAIFSNIFHIGSSPAHIGIFFRPHSTKDSLNNILDNKNFSLNFITQDEIKKAHQTSASYDKKLNEFDQVQLESIYYDQSQAPFVKNAPLSMGLSLVEHIPVKTNNTSIVIAKIEFIVSKENLIEDGVFQLEQHSNIAVQGLDTYLSVNKLYQLAYAKPDIPTKEL